MRNMIAAILVAFSMAALGQERAFSSSYFTGDNEYQYSSRQYAGYERDIALKSKDTTRPDGLLVASAAGGWRCYFYGGLENSYSDARISAAYRKGRNFRAGASVSQLYSKDWSPAFFDGYARYTRGRYSLEGYLEREAVGTPVTNIMKYSSFTAGASMDFRLSRKSTLVLAMARNEISDGNVRWYQTARMMRSFDRNSYVDFKIRRMFGSEWSPYYFSPRSIVQANAGYGIYSDLKKGGLKLYAGAGIQEIEGSVMSMFSIDAKVSLALSERWSCEAVASSRNFNQYLYHTLTLRFSYDLKKKKPVPNR